MSWRYTNSYALFYPSGPSILTVDTCTATVGTAVGVSPLWCPSLWECWWLMFSATFQEGPIKRPTDPTTLYDELGTNKKMRGDAMEMILSVCTV